jgi:hypothetical protein
MKTTIKIEDNLYHRLEAAAASSGRKVNDLLTEGVRLVLASQPKPLRPRTRIKLPLIDSGLPGKLSIPDDIASRIEMEADIERHEASLRGVWRERRWNKGTIAATLFYVSTRTQNKNLTCLS